MGSLCTADVTPVRSGPVPVGPVPVGLVPVGLVPVGPVPVGPVPVGPVFGPILLYFLLFFGHQNNRENKSKKIECFIKCNLVINHHLLRRNNSSLPQ